MNRTSHSRTGFTLLELLAVMAAILILGAVVAPNLTSVRGDTRTKAGADVMQGQIARARSKAIEDGIAYRLAISTDGKKVRVSQDTFETIGIAETVGDGEDESSGPYVREDQLPEGVKAEVNVDDDMGQSTDSAGWVRIATFLPDGTCREDSVLMKIIEDGVTPIMIRIRGLTGLSTTTREK